MVHINLSWCGLTDGLGVQRQIQIWLQFWIHRTRVETKLSLNPQTRVYPCDFPHGMFASLPQSLLTVGSQAVGEYSPVSKLAMSSASNSKSYTLAFSSILACLADLGSGTNPCSLLATSETAAPSLGILAFCKLQRTRICAAVLLCFFTSDKSRESSVFCALTRGQYACHIV